MAGLWISATFLTCVEAGAALSPPASAMAFGDLAPSVIGSNDSAVAAASGRDFAGCSVERAMGSGLCGALVPAAAGVLGGDTGIKLARCLLGVTSSCAGGTTGAALCGQCTGDPTSDLQGVETMVNAGLFTTGFGPGLAQSHVGGLG